MFIILHRVCLRPVAAGVFATIADPRGCRGRRHDLVGVLAIATVAMCVPVRAAWSRSPGGPLISAAIFWPSRGCCARGVEHRWNPRSAESSKPSTLANCSVMVGVWLLARDATCWKGRMVVAVDGKTLRGAKTRDMAAPHLLAAVTRGGIVARQHQLPAKTGETATLPVLLESLPSNKIVVTLMRCTLSTPLPAPLPDRVMTTC